MAFPSPFTHPVLQTLPPLRFNREQQHGHKRSQEQSSRGIDRGLGIGLPGIDRDDGGAKTGDTVEAGGDSGSRTAVRCREDFGRAVENRTSAQIDDGQSFDTASCILL